MRPQNGRLQLYHSLDSAVVATLVVLAYNLDTMALREIVLDDMPLQPQIQPVGVW